MSTTRARSLRLSLVGLLVAGIAAAALAPSAAASTTAASRASAAGGAGTPGTSAWRERGAVRTGGYSASRMSATFVLRWRDASALKRLVSAPHAALSPAQFTARFAPSAATIATLSSWAHARGLTVTSVSANRLLVTVSGSSQQLARALDTSFSSFRSARSGRFHALTTPAHLPASLAPAVAAVVGLSDLGRVSVPHPAPRSGATRAAARGSATGAASTLGRVLSRASLPSLDYPNQYTPQDFWSMYDAPSAQTGGGQQLSIIAEGDVSQPKADLATFEKRYGLPSVTWNQINVGTPSSDTSGADEWDLDSQYSTAFAPGVGTLNVYVASSLNDPDILATINRWVTDDLSKQGSFSAGECDLLSTASGFSSGLDAVLQQADAQGQTLFSSSGDTGSQCPPLVGVNGVPAGVPDTSYPASSPYGIGVGGTSVLSSHPLSEIAWYAGGGGFSPVEPSASYQSSTRVAGIAPMLGRGVPDVSLDADPESGYDVVVGGTVEVVGGTSASAPSWQGIWARAQGAHGGDLGFAGPVLYTTVPSSAFHDITIGSNGLYAAAPGYDLVTGLGTPDIAKLVAGA